MISAKFHNNRIIVIVVQFLDPKKDQLDPVNLFEILNVKEQQSY